MKKELSEEQKIRRAAYAKEWRKRNPEKAKEHSKRTREKNRSKIQVRQQEWRSDNLEYVKAKGKKYYFEHKDEIREYNWLKTYGITGEIYRAMLTAQSEVCAICGTLDPGKGEFFAIDHDHATSQIRGLLCVHCNVGLGHFNDDPKTMTKAIKYLQRSSLTLKPTGNLGTPDLPVIP